MDQSFLGEKSWSEKLKIVFWIVILAAVVLVVYMLVRGQSLVTRAPDNYQAVFLDNNQVYFGRLKSVNRDLWSLTDIYYLRAGTVQNAGTGSPEDKLDLIKLGGELHGPLDEMIINKEHVVFYEDISESGEIMKLIRKHQTGK